MMYPSLFYVCTDQRDPQGCSTSERSVNSCQGEAHSDRSRADTSNIRTDAETPADGAATTDFRGKFTRVMWLCSQFSF